MWTFAVLNYSYKNCRKYGQNFIYALTESMAFPICLVTKVSIIQWNYAEISCIKLYWKRRRNVGNPCRNHFMPFSEMPIFNTLNLSQELHVKNATYHISWKSGIEFSRRYWITKGRSLHIGIFSSLRELRLIEQVKRRYLMNIRD
jgi:hypothetical protein